MDLYELDLSEEQGYPVKRNIRSTGIVHAFWLDTKTRRMVCEKCGGLMNECQPICAGVRKAL